MNRSATAPWRQLTERARGLASCTKRWAILGAVVVAGCVGVHRGQPEPSETESRAIAFLKKEVPAWSRDNGCFSCHNNGDAARALYAATQRGHHLPANVLADTTAWLAQPKRWDDNKGDPGFSDQRLANLQFAVALAAAAETGQVPDRQSLREAARRVAADQGPDGAWPIEPHNAVGSPATYGTTLATYLAARTLRHAAPVECAQAIQKADAWLRRAPANNVPSAATLLLHFADRPQEAQPRRLDECLDLVRRAQTANGGWGPYVDSPAEPFDTALVLLALQEWKHRPGVASMIQRGRAFLAGQQQPDGGWPATTRPPGGDSYAQRLSTTGWAALALLGTRN